MTGEELINNIMKTFDLTKEELGIKDMNKKPIAIFIEDEDNEGVQAINVLRLLEEIYQQDPQVTIAGSYDDDLRDCLKVQYLGSMSQLPTTVLGNFNCQMKVVQGE
jgi:hypothetical protein